MTASTALEVVVIEDDANLMRLYSMRFGAARFPVEFHGFTDAQTAIAHMDGLSADLIIVDMQLPDIDGYALINTLFDRFAMYGTKVIVISGRDEADIRANGALPKDVSVFPKPVPFDYLLEKMEWMHSIKQGISPA